jgi:hypothetical protein
MSDAIMQNALRRQARLDPIEIDPVTLEAVPMLTYEVVVRPTHLIFYGQLLEGGGPNGRACTVSVPATLKEALLALVEDATPGELEAVDLEHRNHVAECERGSNSRSYEPDPEAAFVHVLRRARKPIVSARLLTPEKQRKTG